MMHFCTMKEEIPTSTTWNRESDTHAQHIRDENKLWILTNVSNWAIKTMFKKKARNQGVELVDEKSKIKKQEDMNYNTLVR